MTLEYIDPYEKRIAAAYKGLMAGVKMPKALVKKDAE